MGEVVVLPRSTQPKPAQVAPRPIRFRGIIRFSAKTDVTLEVEAENQTTAKMKLTQLASAQRIDFSTSDVDHKIVKIERLEGSGG